MTLRALCLLASLSAAPAFAFHSIIGIGEKPTATDAWLPTEALQTSLCTGNGDTVENPGTVYQELSKLTGGLRFPIWELVALIGVGGVWKLCFLSFLQRRSSALGSSNLSREVAHV